MQHLHEEQHFHAINHNEINYVLRRQPTNAQKKKRLEPHNSIDSDQQNHTKNSYKNSSQFIKQVMGKNHLSPEK